MLFSCLVPDLMLDSYDQLTPELLRERGVTALLSDIDNTLAPYEQDEPDEALCRWLDSLKAAGISVALISNNDQARVQRFNQTLRLPAVWKSGKPHGRSLRRMMRCLGVTPAQTAMLGDQLLTDAYAAKHLGIFTVIVPPIRDKKTLFVRFKRRLERPFLRLYARHTLQNQGKDTAI